jgi:hypothetical protein
MTESQQHIAQHVLPQWAIDCHRAFLILMSYILYVFDPCNFSFRPFATHTKRLRTRVDNQSQRHERQSAYTASRIPPPTHISLGSVQTEV